jgi:thiamine kinase-like enzyme
MTRAATWLREFHAARSLPPRKLDTDEKLETIDRIGKRCGHNHMLFQQAQAALHRHERQARSIALSASWVHGDFKPDNLILSKEAIFGIDIHARSEGNVLYDIAQFLNGFDLNVSSWRTPQLRFHTHDLFDHFVKCYLDDSNMTIEQVAAPLYWVRLYMLLYGWRDIGMTMRGSLRGCFLRRQYRQATARALLDLEKTSQ